MECNWSVIGVRHTSRGEGGALRTNACGREHCGTTGNTGTVELPCTLFREDLVHPTSTAGVAPLECLFLSRATAQLELVRCTLSCHTLCAMSSWLDHALPASLASRRNEWRSVPASLRVLGRSRIRLQHERSMGTCTFTPVLSHVQALPCVCVPRPVLDPTAVV